MGAVENTEQPMDEQEAIRLLKQQVGDLQKENDAALNTMARQGVQVHPDSITRTMIAVLLDQVLGKKDGKEATLSRMLFEYEYQQRVQKMVADVQTQVNRQRLMAGVRESANGLKKG